jgi:hypothetical protein
MHDRLEKLDGIRDDVLEKLRLPFGPLLLACFIEQNADSLVVAVAFSSVPWWKPFFIDEERGAIVQEAVLVWSDGYGRSLHFGMRRFHHHFGEVAAPGRYVALTFLEDFEVAAVHLLTSKFDRSKRNQDAFTAERPGGSARGSVPEHLNVVILQHWTNRRRRSLEKQYSHQE